MFAEVYDPTSLRQGDVIADVLFPLSKIQTAAKLLGTFKKGVGQHVELAGETEKIGKSWWLTAQINAATSHCTVLSQDCDVASNQNPPPPSFVLCRLVPMPDGMRKDQDLYDRLKANLDPYGSERPYYRLFYFGRHQKLGGDEFIADYGMTMTVGWRDYDAVLKRKILELDDQTRAKFRVKAGAHFGRPSEEEINSGLADPWKGEPVRQSSTEPIGQRIMRAYRVLIGKA